MECRTKTGLLLLIIGTIFGILSNILLFLLGSAGSALSSVGSIGGLLSFIGIILLILGRKEFGEKHRKFVEYALVLWLIAIIVPTIVIAGVVFAYVSQSTSGGADPRFLQNIFMIIPIASIISGLAYVLLLYELENKIGRMVLFAAIAVSVITSIVITLSIGSAVDETIGSIDFETASQQDISTVTTEFSQKISTSGIYGVANGVLMLIALIIHHCSANEEVEKVFYPGGQLQSEMPYENGKPQGIYKYYYQGGELNEETHYKDGQKEGIYRWYYEN